MTIKIFGNLNDSIKHPIEMEFPVTLGSFRKILNKKYPELQTQIIRIAIDQEISDDETLVLTENNEIALLPPFSGG